MRGEFYLFITQFYLFWGNSWSFLTLFGDYIICLKKFRLNTSTQYYTTWPMKRDIFAVQEEQADVENQIVNQKDGSEGEWVTKGLVWSKYEQGGEKRCWGNREERRQIVSAVSSSLCQERDMKSKENRLVSSPLFSFLNCFSRNGLFLFKTRSFLTWLAMAKSYKWRSKE